MTLTSLDNRLLNPPPRADLEGARRFTLEFLYFCVKNLRSCLFAGLLFTAVSLVPPAGLLGLPQYDALLVIALAVPVWMVLAKLETRDDLKTIALCFVAGFALEVFKTSSSIQSWSYSGFAYTKLFGVPLFAGLIYAAVGSAVIQAWRLFQICIMRHPPYWLACAVAIVVYANFFTHHYIGDYRLYISACAAGLYARATVVFRPMDRDRKLPLLLSFVLFGFFIWFIEKISDFCSLWSYLNPLGAWSTVHVGKWSSCALFVVITFIIIAKLKFIKAHTHVAD